MPQQPSCGVPEKAAVPAIATLRYRHDQIVFAANYFPNDLNRRFALQQLCLNLNSLFANRCGERLKLLYLFLPQQVLNMLMVLQ